MRAELMELKILLPSQVFAEKPDVLRLVAETGEGSVGFLPHRLDCVAALAPGILLYETQSEGEAFVALDEGVLVKAGLRVWIAARRAVGGADLDLLRAAVEREFKALDARERSVRQVTAKLEAGLLNRLARFRHA